MEVGAPETEVDCIQGNEAHGGGGGHMAAESLVLGELRLFRQPEREVGASCLVR